MSLHTPIRIGTRGSQLALAQAHEVRARLIDAHSLEEQDFDIRVISTAGDRIQDRPLSEVGGKGLFSKEIENALLRNEIDLAVHSTKDMASVLPDGLGIIAYLPREDVQDAFLSPVASKLADLLPNAVVGSSSLRRQALIKRMRPDIEVVMFRGNVQTRLMKLEMGDVSGTLLAKAGLSRLGLEDRITSVLDLKTFPPAPGQGAICIEAQLDNQAVADLVAPINHTETEIALTAERAFLRALDGSCRTPIAGYAHRDGDGLSFAGMVLSVDGQTVFEGGGACAHDAAAADELGDAIGTDIRARAGADFFHHWT